MASAPISLTILKMVMEYGQIPRAFLYSRVTAPKEEVDKHIQSLVASGALREDQDQLSAGAQ